MNKHLRNMANKITAKYSKWLNPAELQQMYDELESIGITVGMVRRCVENETIYSVSCYNWRGFAEVYVNGIECENIRFVYGVYTDLAVSENKNEYTIYFS